VVAIRGLPRPGASSSAAAQFADTGSGYGEAALAAFDARAQCQQQCRRRLALLAPAPSPPPSAPGSPSGSPPPERQQPSPVATPIS
jgi:hypothetical protein